MAAPMMKNSVGKISFILRYLNTTTVKNHKLVNIQFENYSSRRSSLFVQLERTFRSGERCFSDKQGQEGGDDDATSSDDEPGAGMKLSARPTNKFAERRRLEKAAIEDDEMPFAQRVMNAAEAVGKMTGDPSKTMGDLLSRLQTHSSGNGEETEKNVPQHQSSLGDLLSGMQLEENNQKARKGSDRNVIGMEELGEMSRDYSVYTGARLNIFDVDLMNRPKKKSLTPLMDKVREDELKMFANFPPENAFEEMIRWTKEGKMWKFPIDNEQGLDEEKNTPFTEHVFLDHLIEDFPKKGPIRHFMELVIVGLSKNPYLTVEEKHKQVDWFREYFKDKMHLVEYEDSSQQQISNN